LLLKQAGGSFCIETTQHKQMPKRKIRIKDCPILVGEPSNLQQLQDSEETTVEIPEDKASVIFDKIPQKGDILNLSVFGQHHTLEQAVKIVDFSWEKSLLVGVIVKPSVFII
jgi:hypothetical protein